MERTLTLGEKRVVMDFNPSGDPAVTDFKARIAALIDDVDGIPDSNSQTARWKAEAITQFEYASGFAVKALTAGQDAYLDARRVDDAGLDPA